MRERTYEIKIEGVPIIVTKKRMKNMYLRISKEDGTVRISAPHQMSDARIVAFAGERIEWIRKYRQKYKEAGERRSENRELDAAEIARRKKLLKREVERLVAKWEPVMGVKVSGITIRQMENGYVTEREEMVMEDGKYYPMMRVHFDASAVSHADSFTEEQELEFRYGKQLLTEKHPVLLAYLRWEVQIQQDILTQLSGQPATEQIAARIDDVKQILAQNARALAYYE